MIKVKWSIVANAACAFMLTSTLAAANKPTAKAAKDLMPAQAVRSAWPQETISGKITMVDANQKLVVIEVPEGATFDMVVTAKTRIKSGDQAIDINDLTRDINKAVSVKFIPGRRGDVAKSIQISG
jgi:hypothetical protein